MTFLCDMVDMHMVDMDVDHLRFLPTKKLGNNTTQIWRCEDKLQAVTAYWGEHSDIENRKLTNHEKSIGRDQKPWPAKYLHGSGSHCFKWKFSPILASHPDYGEPIVPLSHEVLIDPGSSNVWLKILATHIWHVSQWQSSSANIGHIPE